MIPEDEDDGLGVMRGLVNCAAILALIAGVVIILIMLL